MSDYVLETRKLTKAFGSQLANKNIDFKVRKGSIHAVIGENGAGKSTLMNMVAGLIKPTSGEIILNGKNQVFRSPHDASRHGIGMVHQEFMLYPDLSVVENFMMGFETTKLGMFLNKVQVKKDLEVLCKQYNFSVPYDNLVRDLPVSIKQQVEIVKVLYRGAEIIILDEPTSVLTPQGIEGLFLALRTLRDDGKTIILITHKLSEVMEIADYITVLKGGIVTGNVLPSEVNEKKLAQLMVGRDVLFNTQKPEKTVGKELFKVENLNVFDDNGIQKVRDVSFSVKQGEIVGIAGVAGSGQTELVESLFGLRKSASGKITLSDEEITHVSTKAHRNKGIGYVPQDRIGTGSNIDASVMDNAIIGYHLNHCKRMSVLLNKEEASAFAEQIVKNFSVKTEGIKNAVRNLSGGNIQKLVVGREFSQDNCFLIVEDPTRGIDVGAIEFIWQEIVRIADNGISVLLISHELSEVMELSDRILVMYNGEIVADLLNQNLTEEVLGLYMLGGKRDAVS